jgi:SPP1 family phage portal protein
VLTNLDFLNIGKTWPPPEEALRLQRYNENRLLFEGEHTTVYAEQFKRIIRADKDGNKAISFEIVVNFHKKLSLKVADLLLGEPPKITCGDAEGQEQKSLDLIMERNDLINTAYEVTIDVSRHGDGLFYIYQGENGGVIDVTQPAMWFPVVSPDNVKKILYQVLAWTYEVGEGQNKKTYLKAQIHEKGKYTEREYELVNCKLSSQTVADKTISTGLSDFAIVRVPNLLTSDRIFGIDDYEDVDSIISEIEVRLSQIAKILDKHAEPSMQGPQSALQYDEVTETWKVKAGEYFIVEDGEGEVKYLVWDAQLEANFNFLDRLVNLLYTMSEMGSAIFGDMTSKTGQVPSGSALRRLMISPLAKVNRIRMRFDNALKKAIKLCSELKGPGIVSLKDKAISITWQDGLPGDPVEEADIMATRTGSKATMSLKRALKQYDGMSDADADEEIQLIDEDENKTNPLRGSNFPGTDGDGNLGGEE